MPANKKFHFKKGRQPKVSENLSANKIKSCQRAILETLSYRATFEYPLSFYQLANFLLTKKRIDLATFDKSLQILLKLHKVSVKDGKFYLFKSKTGDWNAKYKESLKLIEKAKEKLTVLEKIPWIKFIGITGSIAAFGADSSSDIDVIVITQSNRVWITRGFLFLILKILGELRSDQSPDQKICPNIIIDETNLSWQKNKRNVYVAHEVLMVHPILDRDDTYLKFLRANLWIKGFFGNFECDVEKVSLPTKSRNAILNRVERVAMFFQLKYMAKRITTEIAKENLIHFNKVDSTDKILTDFDATRKKALE